MAAVKTETYDDPAAFRAALTGATKRASRKDQERRPDIPRAAAAPRTGLSTFIKLGWRYTYDGKLDAYRLDAPDGRSTGWQPSEAAACREAKKL